MHLSRPHQCPLLTFMCALGHLQCRLEANYAHQQELDMIPLLMTQGFKPRCAC
eukprot:COSAG06_NODE_30590_length_536_cov_0.800915_1_plen_52_part_01